MHTYLILVCITHFHPREHMGILIKSLELFKDLVPPLFHFLDHNQNRTVRNKFMVFAFFFLFFQIS